MRDVRVAVVSGACWLVGVPLLLSLLPGCGPGKGGAAVLSNNRIAFPVRSLKIGDVAYVTADALRLDKDTHKLYINKEAPTFDHPTTAANIAVRRNPDGCDVDLSANTDLYIPQPAAEADEFPVTSIAGSSPTEPK